MKKIKIFLLAVVATVFVACGGGVDTTTMSSGYLKGDEVVAAMKDPDAVIIDVRVKDQFDAGHIDGAKHIPLADIKNSIDILKPYKDKKIVFYCNSGNQSGQAAKILEDNGFKSVYNADGVKQYNYNLVK